MFPTQTRSQFQLRSQVYQFLGRANCQMQLKTERLHRQRRVLPLRSRPTLQFPPLTAYSGSLTPRQGTTRQDLAGGFLPAEPRFPSPRSSPPGRQRSATPRHATDIASCGGTRAAHDSDSTSLPEPHHGCSSTSGARVPLPDPGTSSGAASGSEVKEDRRARARGRGAVPGAGLRRKSP